MPSVRVLRDIASVSGAATRHAWTFRGQTTGRKKKTDRKVRPVALWRHRLQSAHVLHLHRLRNGNFGQRFQVA